MHELMVTESLLEIALRHAREANAVRVINLYLVIGELSSVVDDSVQFYWDFVSEGTVAEGATLHFRRIPTELACQDCGLTYSPHQDLTCPSCSSSKIKVNAGQEFFVEAIEISNESAEEPAET
jgi:hydrogenase nickel incorporation protein HypA/HybF